MNAEIRKKRRKKKLIPLIVLALILVALIVVLICVNNYNEKKALEKAQLEAESNEVTMIADFDSEAAESISYTHGGETYSFVNNGGTWYLSSDEHFPLKQNIVSGMAYAISSIAVTREINEGNESDYGLDNPDYLIKVKYAGDVKTYEYKIGDYNSFYSGYYFETDNQKYMITSGLNDYFDYDLSSLALLDDTVNDIDKGYINSVKLTIDGESNVIKDEEAMNSLLDWFMKLDYSSDEVVSFWEDDMSKFGIDEAGRGDGMIIDYKREIVSTDAEGNQTSTRLDTSTCVRFGNMADDGRVYYTKDSSTILYAMDSELYDSIKAYVTYENIGDNAEEKSDSETTEENGTSVDLTAPTIGA